MTILRNVNIFQEIKNIHKRQTSGQITNNHLYKKEYGD